MLQRDNKRLYRAYLLKEAMVAVLDCRSEWLARQKLDEWVRWARRSRLGPFKRLAATIREHADGILAYVRSGLSNGKRRADLRQRPLGGPRKRHTPEENSAVVQPCSRVSPDFFQPVV